MNILIITNKVPYPPKDGGSIATWSLAKSLAQNHCKVDMLAMNTQKHYVIVEAIKNETDKYIQLFSVDIDTSLSAYDALTNLIFSTIPYNAQRFISKKFEKKLIEILAQNNYNVVQLEGLYLAPYIETVRKYSDAIVAMRSHNVEHEIWKRSVMLEKNRLKKFYLDILVQRIKKMETENLLKNDVFVPITQRDANIFKQLGNKKPTHVCPTGIDTSEIKKIDFDAIEYPSLYHLGALDWLPNQDGLRWFFDEIWDTVVAQNPKLKFHLAGRNAPIDFERKMRYKNLIYYGEIERVEPFVRNKAILIAPLLSGSGMRIKIIEAMAQGKCIITTTIGAEGIHAENGKHLLIADTPEEFTAAIQKAVTNIDFYKKISTQAQQFVIQQYDSQTIAAHLIKFYKSF